VEQSVDLLLSSQELAEAFDPYSRLTSAATAAATATTAAAGPSAASGDARVNTQVRSKGADGRLWVQFETGAAAEQTLAAAKLVAQLAGSRRDQ
jgi:hypothetical protein